MSSHFFFAALPTWGHLRPQLILALNLLIDYPDLYITLVSHVCVADNVSKEIQNFGVSESVVDRLKIELVGTIIPGPSPFPRSMAQLGQAIPKYIATQVKTWKSITSQKFDVLPSLILADMFISSVRDAVKSACAAASIPGIPIYMFKPTVIASHLGFNAPDGHIETFLKRAEQWKLEDAVTYAKMSSVEILAKAYFHSDGRVVNRTNYTGLDPIYDYEFFPQCEATLAQTFIVLPTCSEFEPGLAKQVEELGHSCVAVGPQFSPKFWAGDFSAGALTPTEQDCLDFLDAAEARYGKNSVLYISFGSVFFPLNRPDLVYTLLESLVTAEPPVPFLFALAGAPPDIAAEITKFVASSTGGMGKVSSWTPQMKVLGHNATGWFLTHGGSNSLWEALLASVPLIFWPITADQPAIASQFTLNLKISYELMQVRNGPSVGKPTYRGITPIGTKDALIEELNDLWKKIRGPDGEATRQRVGEANALMRKSHTDGASKQALKHFQRFIQV